MLKQAIVHLINLIKEKEGAEVAEVGIWLALIVAGSIALINTLGVNIVDAFTAINKAFPGAP